MASLRDIRKRIRSVKNTRQITKAMKMVAAAKLRKAQEAIVAARPYANGLENLVSSVAAASEGFDHPLFETRPVKRVELLVITSDRGLAGGFNANVNRRALKFVQEQTQQGRDVELVTAGRKGHEFFRSRGRAARKDCAQLLQKVTFEQAAALAQDFSERFAAGQVDEVYACYNEFVSAISQRVTVVKLLPLATQTVAKAEASPPMALFEPSQGALLSQLLPRVLSTRVFRGLLESVASEHGARMSAMENATKNAGEMISRLTLFYNRTRQAAITKELMEIVSGAEALK